MPTRPCRVSALDDVGDPDAPPGSQPWAKWMLSQAKLRRRELQRDVTGLQEIIRKLEKHDAWKSLGFASFNLLCYAELDLDDEEVSLIRTATRGRALGAVLARTMAADPEVTALDGHGGDRKGEQGNNVTLKRRGNQPEYLIRRLKRDRPDIAERLAGGEFPSARAAAIAAGIVKVPTPLDILKRAWTKASKAQRDKFIDWIDQ